MQTPRQAWVLSKWPCWRDLMKWDITWWNVNTISPLPLPPPPPTHTSIVHMLYMYAVVAKTQKDADAGHDDWMQQQSEVCGNATNHLRYCYHGKCKTSTFKSCKFMNICGVNNKNESIYSQNLAIPNCQGQHPLIGGWSNREGTVGILHTDTQTAGVPNQHTCNNVWQISYCPSQVDRSVD